MTDRNTEEQQASLRAAVDSVADLFKLAAEPNPPFPPAEVFSEGWMLRLLLNAHTHGHGGLPIARTPGSAWYSEARLASPFQPSRRGDPNGEGLTHVDGVIGQFTFRPDTTAGFTLNPDASQFVVVEAKMKSRLKGDVSNVSWWDQAARNIAAMAWSIHQADRDPDSFDSLAFIVIAPQDRLAHEPTFTEYTNREGVDAKTSRRVAAYSDDDPTRHDALLEFYQECFTPFLTRLDIQLVSWEQAIDAASIESRGQLGAFYQVCRRHNGLDR